MKRFCLFFLLASISLVLFSCKGKVWEPPRNIVQTLPDKVHVEYNGIVYAKDGNEIYAKSGVYSMGGRGEVIVKENLKKPAIVVKDDKQTWEQYYISACWVEPSEGNGSWRIANTEKKEETGDEPYHANDHNHSAVYGTVDNVSGPDSSAYMLKGYSDVNSVLESTTVTQLENEIVQVGENDVVCKVFDSVFEYNGTYSKSRYYYAADSGIYIKSYTIYSKDAEITEDTKNSVIATYYKVGDSLDTILEAKNRLPRPDFSAFE